MIWRLLERTSGLLPSETAHRLAVGVLGYNIGPIYRLGPSNIDLRVQVGGLDFANPIGLAAGFDKNAACFNGAFKLGFGHVEVGTITPQPQPGNPKPRVFRLSKHNAVINRYGFNNDGMQVAAKNLASNFKRRGGIVGVNVGANKSSSSLIDDYREAVTFLAKYADYISLNVSSPNTPGLRDLQARQNLKMLLEAVNTGLSEANLGEEHCSKKPIFLKVAPDLHKNDLASIIETCIEFNVNGVIATNTTLQRPCGFSGPFTKEPGGLSGAPLFHTATSVLAYLAKCAPSKLGLIGAGGVANGWQAYAKVLVGADLVQLYTAMIFGGLAAPRKILKQFQSMMVVDGVRKLEQIKGQLSDPDEAIRHAKDCFKKI